nr:hypothetical protein [Mesorhizobium sp.]
MTMIAYAFLQSRRLKQAGGGKKIPRPAPRRAVRRAKGPILVLQDTTEFIYSRALPDRIGFTRTPVWLSRSLVHPLGLTAVKFWTRAKFREYGHSRGM